MKARIEIGAAVAVLTQNADEHIVEYQDAVEVWVADAKSALDTFAKALDRDSRTASIDALWRIMTAKPIDNRPQYSKFINMLERARMGGETHVECDEDDYDRIFQDQWDWRLSSKARNTTYSSRKPN